ncbi:putative metal transport system ATP-binding protein CT_416 [Desulfamplus magnetovallimortis]|uniref:Putative metal transport system ATP-binding protein CT_416 n=1 Tax=Desulfamplus magnetovallimortis TaxID=1246637 RepID=A0A1W1H656_9BACT|nr:ATP-binding cassette domain-containing protein [Desulfamplus magnetovallimortis]SLM27953.1 putative metal transport system ATP-binding protein CT_416 [Desulfamplus magnetovallimortis]
MHELKTDHDELKTGYAAVLENLFFSYGDREVLQDVNLKISHGEFATIVGPNGGGKTTLLKLLLGLLKPVKGNVKVLGQSPSKSRMKVGYMPQYSHLDVKFPVSVMDVVLMGRLGKNPWGWGRYKGEDRMAAARALEEVNLVQFGDTHFNELSGGQKQRVFIARALCGDPQMLLLDEPTSNIDQESEQSLFMLLKELNKKMTILLVSHDLGFASKVVKSVICVNRKVVIHPTTEMDGTVIKDIYGGDFRMIRHDHRCCELGHEQGDFHG